MSDVKGIETAIREHDTLSFAPIVSYQGGGGLAVDDFAVGGAHDSGGRSRGGGMDSVKQFFASDGRRTALHDDQSSGHIGNMSGFDG